MDHDPERQLAGMVKGNPPFKSAVATLGTICHMPEGVAQSPETQRAYMDEDSSE